MLTLQDIFDQLTYGELAQLSIGGADKGGIQPKDYPRIIAHLNLALTALHARFPIKEKEVIIQEFAAVGIYHLDPKYAVSTNDPTVPYKYIIDTVDAPFIDDIIRIDAVYNELGVSLGINDNNSDCSVFTPTYDSIQVPNALDTNTLFVTYRARATKIEPNPTDPSLIEIELPEILIEAVLAYIASRIHASRSSDVAQQESATMSNKYERICMDVERRNLLHNGGQSTNIKLEVAGWV